MTDEDTGGQPMTRRALDSDGALTADQRITERAIGVLAMQSRLTTPKLLQVLQSSGLEITLEDLDGVLNAPGSPFVNDGASNLRWALRPPPDPEPPTPLEHDADGRHEHTPGTLPPLYAWQAEALRAWDAADRRGVVEAVTGTGKTLVGLAAVADAVERGSKALVVVPSIELQRQWSGLLRAHVPAARVGRIGDGATARWVGNDVIVAVVNSLRNAELPHPGPHALLVADECHRYGSQGNARVLNPRFAQRLGLSATYARNDEGNEEHLDPYFGGTCFQMDYRRAIGDEVTAHYKVAFVGVPFTPSERVAYKEANTAAFKAQRWLVEGGWVREEPFGEFMKDVSVLADGGHGDATWKARAFLQNFAERRRILAESSEKMRHLAMLDAAFRGADRSIVFTQTVEAATSAADTIRSLGITAAAVHSGVKHDERRSVLASFSRGDLPVICAPQVLDEGIDVPAADLAVIVAASRTRRQMVQRMGRVLRRKPDGRVARFVILYVESSSEDPANGAHGDFLDEITDTAETVRAFPAGSDPAKVAWFLNDYLARGQQTPPSMAESSWPDGARGARGTASASTRPGRTSAEEEMVDHLVEWFRTRHGHDAVEAQEDKLRLTIGRLLGSGIPSSTIRQGIGTTKDVTTLERSVRAVHRARGAASEKETSASAGAEATGKKRRKRPPRSQPLPPRQWTSAGPPRLCPSCGIAEHACRC